MQNLDPNEVYFVSWWINKAPLDEAAQRLTKHGAITAVPYSTSDSRPGPPHSDTWLGMGTAAASIS